MTDSTAARKAAPRGVELHVGAVNGRFYGFAHAQGALAATAVGDTRKETLGQLERGLPPGVARRIVDGDRSDLIERTIALLADLEAGREEHKHFELAADIVGGPFAAILHVAAAIPIGYVTTYGRIAAVAGAEARDVGTAMARNPLYPIVPCHRVVGADFALVGYAGSRGAPALQRKLDRLLREARGFAAERDVPAGGADPLRVYPVERAIARARDGESRQRALFE